MRLGGGRGRSSGRAGAPRHWGSSGHWLWAAFNCCCPTLLPGTAAVLFLESGGQHPHPHLLGVPVGQPPSSVCKHLTALTGALGPLWDCTEVRVEGGGCLGPRGTFQPKNPPRSLWEPPLCPAHGETEAQHIKMTCPGFSSKARGRAGARSGAPELVCAHHSPACVQGAGPDPPPGSCGCHWRLSTPPAHRGGPEFWGLSLRFGSEAGLTRVRCSLQA